MFNVFFCYSSNDRAMVKRTSRRANRYGISIFAHEYDLLPLSEKCAELEQAAANSDAMVVFISEKSECSPSLERIIAFAEKIIPVIPIVECGSPIELLTMFDGRRCVRFDRDIAESGFLEYTRFICDLDDFEQSCFSVEERDEALMVLGSLIAFAFADHKKSKVSQDSECLQYGL